MVHVNEEGDAYKKFFSAALKKYGVKSPHELDDKKKRSFFNYIEKNYKAKDEVVEAKLNEREPVAKEKDMIKKLDNAYSHFMLETITSSNIKKTSFIFTSIKFPGTVLINVFS